MGWIWIQGIESRGRPKENETGEALLRVTVLTARI